MYKSGLSRRLFLKSTSLLGSFAAASSALSQANDLTSAQSALTGRESKIGYWIKDKLDLPVFRYIARPVKPGTEVQKSVVLEDDPYFLLGNYRLTTFVHSSGVVRVMSGERAWAKLNEGADSLPDNRARLLIKNKTSESKIELIGSKGIAREPQLCTRDFGIGYANFAYNTADIKCRRTISVSPSKAINSGLSAYLVEVELENAEAYEQEIVYEETVLAHYVGCMDRNSPEDKWPVQYSNSISHAVDSGLVSCKFSAHPKDPSMQIPDGQAGRNDLSPPDLFVKIPRELNTATNGEVFSAKAEKGDHLGARFAVKISAGKKVNIYFVVGTQTKAESTDIEFLVNTVLQNKGKQISPFLDAWNTVLPDVSHEKDKNLRGEMQWNAYVLEAMATYSDFYKETFIPQGMTYDYTIGLTAAPRDHLQHCLPLCYTNPALAKSTIRFVLKKMTYQGEIKYTDIGYGRTSNSAWNTSDQQLYLFLAVSEYLRITNDFSFLEEKTEFLPMEAHYSATTLEKLRRAFAYLRDEVNVGPHGLIRLMNSDWNDMIFMDTPVMKNFWTAESHMNSAMGLCVLPALIQQLEVSQKKLNSDNQQLCTNLIGGLRMFEKSNRDAFYKDLQSRTFSRRLYLAAGEALGEKDMHIEPQIFLMQDANFPREKKKILWHEIQDRLLDKELLEPRQRERGVPGAQYIPGTGENGGLWHSLTGPLVIGLASVDKKSAFALLERMTFSHFAKCYPEYWVGHWTSPDTINTYESGEIAGLPRNGDAGFWFNFAAYCAHAHAWPLYVYLRLKKDDITKA